MMFSLWILSFRQFFIMLNSRHSYIRSLQNSLKLHLKLKNPTSETTAQEAPDSACFLLYFNPFDDVKGGEDILSSGAIFFLGSWGGELTQGELCSSMYAFVGWMLECMRHYPFALHLHHDNFKTLKNFVHSDTLTLFQSMVFSIICLVKWNSFSRMIVCLRWIYSWMNEWVWMMNGQFFEWMYSWMIIWMLCWIGVLVVDLIGYLKSC